MSISQQVYADFMEGLRLGKYKPGDRIRAEDVAKAFQVSRTPVREALSRLQERGLLEITASGLSVTQMDRAGVLELYAIRELLEGAAARFAAQHASPSDLYSMQHIAEAFAACEDDPPRVAQLNRAFHDAIYEAAHNKHLLNLLAGMHDTLMLMPNTTFMVKNRQSDSVVEHNAILEAIEKRDPDAAEQYAREHIRKARDTRLGMMFRY
ncbi:GntR family transcriptional regulator [Alterinioella nitratireducens]|uniref:GntR family transcriptional regulator n=1 Tax=Alterinioella nitratireducens TaxID=2735915 RepID=UPI0015575D1C|nr:GntR family transcriptional regulator [Alterinioella nitratireducens]NPD21232.1 GntR family transcriptional regulator [Alterinioella nitratireducens]